MSDTYRLQTPTTPPSFTSRSPDQAVTSSVKQKAPGRLVSLDAYRGFIMMMLAANAFGIGKLSTLAEDNGVWKIFDYTVFQRLQFHVTHPAWESVTGVMGVSFWDMIQPSFMFMVGVAMPFSYARRTVMGSSKFRRAFHAFVRAAILVLLGAFLSSQRYPQTTWVFTNVLSQIGLGYFFAYLLLGQSSRFHVGAIAVILVSYWGFFMINGPPKGYEPKNATVEAGEIYEGKFAPWSKNANAAHFFDEWFLNTLRMPVEESVDSKEEASSNQTALIPADPDSVSSIRRWWFSSPKQHTHNPGGYTTLNFIPSIATTLLGVLCGQLFLGTGSASRKLFALLIGGAVCLSLGLLAHHTVCPIVKRIWTPSWVLFAGGYSMWFLAAFYLLFDILPLRKLAFPLVVVGMNSIAIYMMGQLLRPWVTEKIVKPHLGGVLKSMFGPDALSTNAIGAMVLPTATFAIFWLTALWMYRNRYFVRV